MSHRPAVFAHRGDSLEEAEHTLVAYRKALELGVDGLECDVRMTADGHLVLLHDRRIDRTSNGSGIVSTMTLRELEQHDFGSWWGDAEDEDAGRVLTLPELLGLVRDCGRPVRLLIETKHPTRFAGLLEKRLVEELGRFGMLRPIPGRSSAVVMSFSEMALWRMHRLAPAVPTVFLMERLQVQYRKGYLPFGATVSGPSMKIINKHPGYVRRAHRADRKVFVWVVDRMDDLKTCVDLGVDGVITNRPGKVLKRLHKLGAR